MQRSTLWLPLALLLVMTNAVAAQTTISYRGMTVLSGDPPGSAGLAWQNNFKALADRLGNHFEVAGDPTLGDDQANTAGNGPAMYLATWRNTIDQTLWICLDASPGAANWCELFASSDGSLEVDGRVEIGGTSYLENSGSALDIYAATAIEITADQGVTVISGFPQLNIDAATNAGIYLDRASTGFSSQLRYKTGGSDKWRVGQLTSGNDLQFSYYSGGWQTALSVGDDGVVSLPNDNQKLAFGAAGFADSYFQYTGTHLAVFSTGGIHFVGNVGVHSDPHASTSFVATSVDTATAITGGAIDGIGINGYSSSSYGGYFTSTSGIGVRGKSSSSIGVRGDSTSYIGLYGISSTYTGVYGASTTGRGGYFGRSGDSAQGTLAVVSTSETDHGPAIEIDHVGTGEFIKAMDGGAARFVVANNGDTAIGGSALIGAQYQLRANETPGWLALEFPAATVSMANNLYWSSGWKYRGTDFGTTLDLSHGKLKFQGAASGTPSASATLVKLFEVDDNGSTYVASDLVVGDVDGVKAVFGAAGASDSYITYSGSALEICSATAIDLHQIVNIDGPLTIAPGSSVIPADNGNVVFELTNNTTFTIKAKGSDGIVRFVALPLTLAP